VSATNLEHLLAVEIHLARRGVIQLDTASIAFVGRLQRHAHRRVLFIGEVEEQFILVGEPSRQVHVGILHKLLIELPEQRMPSDAVFYRRGKGHAGKYDRAHRGSDVS
jgi:hypothetical protein